VVYIVVYAVVYQGFKFVFLFVWSMMLSNLCTWRPHFDVAAMHFSLNYFIGKLVDAWQGFFSLTVIFISSGCRWIPL